MGCCSERTSSGWVYPTAVLSLYVFFANCRVAEPFLTPYLIGPNKNISEEVVNNYLFPIWTYSYLAFLFPVFLLTDFLRHKPLIVVQGFFLVTNYTLLCFAPGLLAMTLLQINYAVVTSTEVAYFSYIYSVIPVENYQRATGYLRSAMLTEYTMGACLGQILLSVAGLDLFYINTITLGIVIVAFLISLWLPMPQRRKFFKGKKAAATLGCQAQQEMQSGASRPQQSVMDKEACGSGKEKMENRGGEGWCSRENLVSAGHLLWQSFRESYSSRHLIYWSVWWSLATAGYVQVFNYVQLMWNHIEPSATSSIYNGGVEAVCSLVGAAAAFTVGHVKVTWSVWGELALGSFSAVGAGAVFLMALTTNIWVCYAGYVIFKSCYMLLITITTFQIASNLSNECYALTFGINTFGALCLQTIMTVIVVDEAALGLDIVTQVTNYLFPIWTYSYLAFLFPVFLLTDFLRHKPLIVVQALFVVTYYTLLCFAPGLLAMILLQISYAVATSTEVAYFSYIYSVIPVKNYQRATGYVRSAMLTGYTFSCFLGQILLSVAGLDLFYINTITLGIAIVAFLISLWLPMPQRSMFFKGKKAAATLGCQAQQEMQSGASRPQQSVMDKEACGSGKEKMENRGGEGWCSRENLVSAGHLLWQSFRESYLSRHLIYWSVWWSLATAGYLQVFHYIQLMWNHVEPSATSSIYNGGVEAVCSLVGAAAAFTVGHVKVTWSVWGELALGSFSAVGAGAVFLMALTTNIWVCYAGYVIFKSCYMLLITITTFQIATNLSMECYALIFGINTFGAICLQTIMTVIVVDEAALGLDIVTQFLVYGSYYAAISVLFLIHGAYTACVTRHGRPGTENEEKDSYVEVIHADRL